MGKDVSKLKAKGGGKWKYMSEADMLKHSEKFAPYRFAANQLSWNVVLILGRSVLMWYLWKVSDVNVAAVEQN